MVIKSLLVISVAALDFAVVPRCAWADRLVKDAAFLAKQVQRVHVLRLRDVIPLADELHVSHLPIQLDRIQSCRDFVL